MMHSRALIATTEPKLDADKAASFGKLGPHHSKRGTRDGEASGNSFSKALKIAGDKSLSPEKKTAVNKSRKSLYAKGRDRSTNTLARSGFILKPGKRGSLQSNSADDLEKEQLLLTRNILVKDEPEDKLKSANGKTDRNTATPSGRGKEAAGTLSAPELASAAVSARNLAEDKKTNSASLGDPSEKNPDIRRSAQVSFRNDEIISEAPRVLVIDRRNREAALELPSAGNHSLRQERNGRLEKSEPVRLENVELKASDTRFAVAETDIDLSPKTEGTTGNRSVAAELARRLDSQAGADIVKQVRIVMNRADSGDIRINLRPDNLGNVRVRLHLEENRLTGRIFVESAAARDAFRSSLDGLQTKLVESGFGAADLELSFDDSAGGFQMNQERRRNSGSLVEAVRDFESMSATTMNDSAGDGRVNLMA